MVRETYEPGMTVSLVARKHGVNPNQVFHWRKLERVGALTAVGASCSGAKGMELAGVREPGKRRRRSGSRGTLRVFI